MKILIGIVLLIVGTVIAASIILGVVFILTMIAIYCIELYNRRVTKEENEMWKEIIIKFLDDGYSHIALDKIGKNHIMAVAEYEGKDIHLYKGKNWLQVLIASEYMYKLLNFDKEYIMKTFGDDLGELIMSYVVEEEPTIRGEINETIEEIKELVKNVK